MNRNMMNLKQLVFSLLFLIFSMGSQAFAQEKELEINVTPNTVFSVQADTPSCVDRVSGSGNKSAMGSVAIFPSFRYKWNGTQPLDITYIKVELSSDQFLNHGYGFIVAGYDLTATLNYEISNQLVRVQPGSDNSAKCPLIVSELPWKSDNEGMASGFVTVYGYTKDVHGNDIGVAATTEISIVKDAE